MKRAGEKLSLTNVKRPHPKEETVRRPFRDGWPNGGEAIAVRLEGKRSFAEVLSRNKKKVYESKENKVD